MRAVRRRRVLVAWAALAIGLPSNDTSHGLIAIVMLVRDALALVDIRLVDHVVIGGGVMVSLAERGVI